MSLELNVRYELVHPEAKRPLRATDGSAGYDAFACLLDREIEIFRTGRGRCAEPYDPSSALVLHPGERALIPLGFKLQFPPQGHCDIRARSGLAWKHGVALVNGMGLGDSDYPGEYGAILINHGQEPFPIRHGERIAQVVFMLHPELHWEPHTIEPTTQRKGGYGHSGV